MFEKQWLVLSTVPPLKSVTLEADMFLFIDHHHQLVLRAPLSTQLCKSRCQKSHGLSLQGPIPITSLPQDALCFLKYGEPPPLSVDFSFASAMHPVPRHVLE